MSKFKLFIMAAGVGSRNTHYQGLHKGLLPIENVPAISRILQNVSSDVEVVIAVGHLKSQLISYLRFVYPERKFTFVNQTPYTGNVGPAHAVLAAKNELNCPFIITTCDTIIPSKIQHTCPTEDWIGVDKLNPVSYACIVPESSRLTRVSVYPIYIGVAGVSNWSKYISQLEITGSKENTDGFTSFSLVPFNWIDTGSDSTYELLNHSILVPDKEDQIVYLDNGKIVKFWTDTNKADRVYKVAKRLNHPIVKINDNMIGYDYIEGTLFSNFLGSIKEPTSKLLDFINSSNEEKPSDFYNLCQAMYELKTRSRVSKFLKEYPEVDFIKEVNGTLVKPISLYLDNIPWDFINSTSIASSKFHGDIQPENIIIKPSGEIVLIDWRDGFAENTEFGDMYYDLGKLYHDLIVSNQKVLQKKFTVNSNFDSAKISIELKPNLIEALNVMEEYCISKNLDWSKIKVLGALQYLSIACLYKDKHFSKFLFLLGKLCLEFLDKDSKLLLENIKMNKEDF